VLLVSEAVCRPTADTAITSAPIKSVSQRRRSTLAQRVVAVRRQLLQTSDSATVTAAATAAASVAQQPDVALITQMRRPLPDVFG